jgi:sec-independent protein translocase protein TatA
MDELPSLLMQMPIGYEWILIIIIALILIFGVKKIPEIARSFGKASGEYEKARLEAKKQLQQIKNQGINPDREKLEEIADTLGIDHSNKSDNDLRIAIEAEIKKSKKRA